MVTLHGSDDQIGSAGSSIKIAWSRDVDDVFGTRAADGSAPVRPRVWRSSLVWPPTS